MDVKKTEFRGVTYINTTPHSITFRTEDGEEFTVEPCGELINASVVEEIVEEQGGITLVRTKFLKNDASQAFIQRILASRAHPADPVPVILGSIIAAQAYPGWVVAMIATKGYDRLPPAEKRMNPFKFTIFS